MAMLTIREKRAPNIQKVNVTLPEEAMIFYPQCKALQTVWMNGNILMPIRKFYQIGNQVYHDCGSGQPCRLYHVSG